MKPFKRKEISDEYNQTPDTTQVSKSLPTNGQFRPALARADLSKRPLPAPAFTKNKPNTQLDTDTLGTLLRLRPLQEELTAYIASMQEQGKSLSSIVRDNFGRADVFEDNFIEYVHAKGIFLKYERSEFLEILGRNFRELGMLFVELEFELTPTYEKAVANKKAEVHALFDEWFNEVNLGVFIDDRNMSVGEIFHAFNSAYNTEGANWKKIRIREGEFAIVFKEHLLEKYNYELKDVVSETIS